MVSVVTRYYDDGMRYRLMVRLQLPAVAIAIALAVACLLSAAGCAAQGGAAGDGSVDASQRPEASHLQSAGPGPSDGAPAPVVDGGMGETPGGGQGGAGTTGGASGLTTRIVFVRVGQGDAIVVESGAWTMLVDGGPPGAEGRVAAVLRRLDTNRLDALVVSHPHQDHVGGLPEIIDDFDPKLALLPPRSGTSAYGELKRDLRSEGSRIVTARKGQSFRFGAVRVRVLSPLRPGGDANEDSVVLLLEAGGKRFLFTGDCTGPTSRSVGSICARGPPLYLLKVAHHGSRYSTSRELPLRDRSEVRRDQRRPQLLRAPDAGDGHRPQGRGHAHLLDAEERHRSR